ncbi:MAG TPA: SH3 domain-containing protein, partial [Desulfosporosinus sp.]|nr:SH3 domain-containing protein [Desulfosporosinus sp.]
MKKILTSVALVMFTLAVPDIVQAATLGTATANPSLNLRQSATTSATVLSSIPKNSQVNVLSKNGSNWYNVVYNGKTGWVSGQYLMVKETVAPVVAPTSAPNVTKT